MRHEIITIYKFNELSEKAKAKACERWRQAGMDFDYSDDLNSIKVFCDYFGVNLTDYQVDAHYPFHYKTNATNEHFRGRKLKDFKLNHMPTGYYLDCSVWNTFYESFKKTGDAKEAFNDALHQGFSDLQKEMEWRDSDQAILETLEINEYEFYEDGTMA